MHLIIPDLKKNLKDKASILFQFPYIHESFSHGYERKIVPPWTLFPKCGLIPTFLFAVIIFCCWCWAFVWFRLNKYLRKVSLVEQHHQNKTNVFCSGFMFETVWKKDALYLNINFHDSSGWFHFYQSQQSNFLIMKHIWFKYLFHYCDILMLSSWILQFLHLRMFRKKN